MKLKDLIKALFIFGAISNSLYVASQSVLEVAKRDYYKKLSEDPEIVELPEEAERYLDSEIHYRSTFAEALNNFKEAFSYMTAL